MMGAVVEATEDEGTCRARVGGCPVTSRYDHLVGVVSRPTTVDEFPSSPHASTVGTQGNKRKK